jgi:tRNA-Thr(GGU) m(6)t(6)A37 methyltransferase TsaA
MLRMASDERPGEVRAPIDPAKISADAGIVFIGRARTPWASREACPKNLRQARERRLGAYLEIDEPWRPGLSDLERGAAIIVLTWFHRARRDLIIQTPRNSSPSGVFSLRSPVRPNPVGLHVVRVRSIDPAGGRIDVDALDCFDMTPLVDMKPWFDGIDIPPA